MSIAEIRDKLGHTAGSVYDRMENLLTSDVFTACRYVRPESLMLPFLRTATRWDGSSGFHIGDDVHSMEYGFWPKVGQDEPDLIACANLADGRAYLLLIESKYLSPKSSGPLSAEELGSSETPKDQLARYYTQSLPRAHEFLGLEPNAIARRAMLYVTAHSVRPAAVLAESVDEIVHFGCPRDKIELYWTNWHALHRLLRFNQGLILPWEAPIVEDLRALLEVKGLICYCGFQALDLGQLDPAAWQYRSQRTQGNVPYRWPVGGYREVGFYVTRR